MFSTPSSLAAVACALFVAASASPDAFPFTNDAPHTLANRADVIITTGAGPEVHPRLELGNLATRDDEWALFIKTLIKWKQAPTDDINGYYDVASIHGVPMEDWNGATLCDGCDGAVGFGVHDMCLFPCFHRLYLAYFEQKFVEAALEVAQSFPQSSRARMLAAHRRLRIPFWDPLSRPAQNSTCLPETLSSPKITINGPDGPETLDNPLYSYKFTQSQTEAMQLDIFGTWEATYRYPASNDPSTTSQDSQAVAALESQQDQLKDQVYQLLTACDSFRHFSTGKAGSSAKCANSLEQIHNSIHTLSGGPGSGSVYGGHLSYLPVASFDLAFWLIHCNTDRIFSIWQTLHPGRWVPTEIAPHSTWVIPAGAELNSDYPLKPFNKDATSYWTSKDCRNWTTFGYDYPEFLTSSGSQSDITAYVNALYGSQPTLFAGDISALIPAGEVSSEETRSPPTTRGDNSTGHGSLEINSTGHGLLGYGSKLNLTLTAPSYSKPSHPASIGGDISSLIDTIVAGVEDLAEAFIDAATGNAYEYACNIQTPRYALNGTYYVYVFSGEPDSQSPSTWLQDKNLIGMMGVLSSLGYMPGHDLIVTGQVPLTSFLRNLVTSGTLLGMDEENILPFLAKNLQWRISKNSVEVDVDSVEGFQASVYSHQVSVLKDVRSLPTYTKYTPQVEVTKGKTGGASKPIFGTNPDSDDFDDADDSDDSPNPPSYGSGSSSSSHAASASKTDVQSLSSTTKDASPTGHEASPSGPATGAYSYGSYAPSASAPPYKSLDTPASYPTAPAGAIPTAYESWATVSQAAETCAAVTTTVKQYETIYITEPPTPSSTAPAYNAPSSPASPPAPVYSAPVPSVKTVVPVPSSPASPSVPISSVETVVPITSSPVETSPVLPSVPVAPYPVPSNPVSPHYPAGSESPVAPVHPTGTGHVYPPSPVIPYTGGASAGKVAGLLAGFGAVVAFFM